MENLKEKMDTILSDYGFSLVLGNDIGIELLPNRYAFSKKDMEILNLKDFVHYIIYEDDAELKITCNIQHVNDGHVASIIGLSEELLELYQMNGNTFWID